MRRLMIAAVMIIVIIAEGCSSKSAVLPDETIPQEVPELSIEMTEEEVKNSDQGDSEKETEREAECISAEPEAQEFIKIDTAEIPFESPDMLETKTTAYETETITSADRKPVAQTPETTNEAAITASSDKAGFNREAYEPDPTGAELPVKESETEELERMIDPPVFDESVVECETEHQHEWEPVYQSVWIIDREPRDEEIFEEVPVYETLILNVCRECGFESYDSYELSMHILEVHEESGGSGYWQRPVQGDQIGTEQKLVCVISHEEEGHFEEQLTGYLCSCGEFR